MPAERFTITFLCDPIDRQEFKNKITTALGSVPTISDLIVKDHAELPEWMTRHLKEQNEGTNKNRI